MPSWTASALQQDIEKNVENSLKVTPLVTKELLIYLKKINRDVRKIEALKEEKEHNKKKFQYNANIIDLKSKNMLTKGFISSTLK